MTWIPIEQASRLDHLKAKLPAAEISTRLRVAGTVLRTVFIVSLLLVILRVSMPQSETVWTAYETPGDLIRMIFGFVVCLWIGTQLFIVPKDAHAYRTWLYLGGAAVPFALICGVAIW
jgi:hypothetical protein